MTGQTDSAELPSRHETFDAKRLALLTEAAGKKDPLRLLDRAYGLLGEIARPLTIELGLARVPSNDSHESSINLTVSTPEGGGTLAVSVTVDEVLALAADTDAGTAEQSLRSLVAREVGSLARQFPPPYWPVGRPGMIDDGYFEGVFYSADDAEHAVDERNARARRSANHDEDNEVMVF